MRISDWSSDVCSSDLTSAVGDDRCGGRTRIASDDERTVAVDVVVIAERIAAVAVDDARITNRTRAVARHRVAGADGEAVHAARFTAITHRRAAFAAGRAVGTHPRSDPTSVL